MRTRTIERTRFLADLLVTAIEHYGYGFPTIVGEYHIPADHEAEWFAEIADRYEADETGELGQTHRVTVDTMAHGIGVMRAKGLGGSAFWTADRTNGDDGDFDVIDALAVLECALFGEVVYA